MVVMDYVLPQDVSYGPLKPLYRKARKLVVDAEKYMWKTGYKGMMDNYMDPLYDTTFFPSAGRTRRMVLGKRRRVYKPYKRSVKRVKRSFRRRALKRGRPVMRKRFSRRMRPAWSQQSRVRRAHRVRPLIPMSRKIDYRLAPYIWEDDGNGLVTATQGTQGAVEIYAGKTSQLNSAMSISQLDGPREFGTWTSYFARIMVRNQTNTPISGTLYYFRCKKSTSKSFVELWDTGLQDVTGNSSGYLHTRKFVKPQMSPQLMNTYKITATKRYLIGGGDQISFPLRLKGDRWIGKSLVDSAEYPEYQSQYTFGLCFVFHGQVVDDGTAAGLSQAKIAWVRDGHYTFRANQNNYVNFGNITAGPTLTAQNVMNVESDQATSVVVA